MLSRAEFEAAVWEAVERIAPAIRDKFQRTVIAVQDDTTPDQRAQFDEKLLGLYGDLGFEPLIPNRIVLFPWPIAKGAEDRGHMIAITQDAILHEVGHFLGLDDDRMGGMGLL